MTDWRDEPLKLFSAGVNTSFPIGGTVYNRCTESEQRKRDSIVWYLESYHYIHKQSMVDRMRKLGVQVFLDSGAFSAMTQGVTIDIGAYCDYIIRNDDFILKVDGINVASVLDHIGTGWQAAEATWKNQQEMEARGAKPLPCFHFGEPVEFLDFYAQNYPYITLGGLVGKSAKVIEAWLDSLWERLVDSDGRPITRVHGFGLTSLPLMMRYPFYSVDSSTWVQWASRGLVLEPLNGWQINISAQSSARKVEGMHIDTIPAPQREALEEIFRAQDIDTQRMRDTYVARWAWDVWAFPEFARLREPPAPRTFKREQKGLFF